jgi:hypothetical protein
MNFGAIPVAANRAAAFPPDVNKRRRDMRTKLDISFLPRGVVLKRQTHLMNTDVLCKPSQIKNGQFTSLTDISGPSQLLKWDLRMTMIGFDVWKLTLQCDCVLPARPRQLWKSPFRTHQFTSDSKNRAL